MFRVAKGCTLPPPKAHPEPKHLRWSYRLCLMGAVNTPLGSLMELWWATSFLSKSQTGDCYRAPLWWGVGPKVHLVIRILLKTHFAHNSIIT